MGEVTLTRKEHLLIPVEWKEPKKMVDEIRRSLPNIEVTFFKTEPGLWRLGVEMIPKELLEKATIIATFLHVPTPQEAPNLKLLHSLSAGVDHLFNHPIMTESDVTITTSSGIHGPSIAEWTVMNWIFHSKQYWKLQEAQKQHKWLANYELPLIHDHVGKRVGILGYGSIGRQIARVAVAMGMTVLAYTASPRPTPESRRQGGYVIPETGDLDGTLPASWHYGRDKASLHAFLSLGLDHVVVCLPLTLETTKLLGAEEFSLLSSNCTQPDCKPYLTNISRGKILDQDALIASLQSGELGGAALDVTDPEPIPADHPLWDAPNIQVTPHMSWCSTEYLARGLDVLRVNLQRMMNGEKPYNVYPKKRGY